jgi:aspartyl protease family protein
VGGYVVVEYRKRMGEALRTAAAWGLIFIGVMAGYGLWNDMRSEVAPQQMVAEGGQIEVPRAADGHYYLTLTIDGTPVQFLADTGATNMVLSNRDARRLGIDPETLVYIGRAQTANGTVATARVELGSVELGPYRDDGFAAWVNQGEMEDSLLGMDYLSLYRVEIAGDRMILRR